ncbi:MAG TPA: SCO family protein [Anaeromyxobacter sp.]
MHLAAPNSFAALLSLALLAEPAAAADEAPGCEHCAKKAQEAARAKAGGSAGAKVELADVGLLDQDGREVRFRDAMSGDRVVVMDFIYTTCTTICPVLSAIMTRIQGALGPRADKVLLVSLSLDPARDTPERMKAFAAKFRAGAGWSWLTGEKGAVERALKGVGAYTASFADHPPMILVGDGRAGTWTRFNGFPKQDQVLARIDELIEARAKLASKE